MTEEQATEILALTIDVRRSFDRMSKDLDDIKAIMDRIIAAGRREKLS